MNFDAAQAYLRRPELDVRELRSVIDDIEHDNLRAWEIIDRMPTFIRGSAVFR